MDRLKVLKLSGLDPAASAADIESVLAQKYW